VTTRTDPARTAVLFHLAAAHDAWAEQEQLLEFEGRPYDAARARIFAQRVIRAWLAERDDPEPETQP
jgi:hypothetical protein